MKGEKKDIFSTSFVFKEIYEKDRDPAFFAEIRGLFSFSIFALLALFPM